MEYALADTDLWYALFVPSDQYHGAAKDKAGMLALMQVVLPWPTVYETMRTKFVRNAIGLDRFERFLKGPNIVFLDDTPFRAAAFELALDSSLRKTPAPEYGGLPD